MEKEDQLDYGFPIVCPRHPQSRQLISKPGQLPTHSPKGGCLQPCEYRLWCGHICPSICHTDQDYHTRMKCNRPCVRVTCPRAHPCPKLCSDDCGNCMFPMYNVRLPCGHIVKSVPCHKLENLKTIKCFVPVSKRLPGCKHCVTIACSGDPSNLVCKEICGSPCPRAHPCPKLCSEDCGNCMSLMYNVRLPCGHIVKSVPCHKLENLETIKCFVPVLKRLPGCEHCVTIACSGDPSDLVCKENCGGHTACCSRTCKSRCHECQEVTRDSAAPRARAVPPVRTHHKSHPCERMLKCQHLCGLACSSDHSCNSKCHQSCRQRCDHQKCQKECWEPCSPCMEPCEWRCPHYTCPVVCGSICSRLPCDKACEWQLECGHVCPSICGEPCEKQTCVICLPDKRKVDIVDFITQRRLDEIDLSSDDISERLITLECGHIFTVGTLDGHCNMSEYYESDAMGAFTATKAPLVNFQTPPTCPACRGPITALRYGRITKKANIDILEQNVASTMSSTLEEVGSEIESFLGRLDNVKSKAKLITFYPPSHAVDFDILSAHRRTRFGPESEPLSREEISQASMTNVHGFSVEEGRAWHSVVHDLLKLYRKIVRVARTRGPYEQVYDVALATLYRLELSAIARDPERASDTPERVAMREVIKNIGQPPHKAGTRLQLEAFFLSFELRYTLAEIAQSRIEGFRVFSGHEFIRLHERLWRSFVSFIYESCIHDAEKALKIAKKSSVSRLAAQAGVNILRGKLELFRFEILAQHTHQFQCGLLNDDRRNELSTKAQLEANTASLEMKKLETRYLRSRRVTDTTQLNSERTWFTQNCREKGDRIVEEYSALATRLTQKECKPLTAMEGARKASSFSQHRRRFFGCINGHAFTIGTCGGAIEVARCPECSAISELPAWLGSIAAASLGASVQTVQRLGGWLRRS